MPPASRKPSDLREDGHDEAVEEGREESLDHADRRQDELRGSIEAGTSLTFFVTFHSDPDEVKAMPKNFT